MKYIRTNDGVYEINDKYYNVFWGNLTEEEREKYKDITSFSIWDFEKNGYKKIPVKDMIAQSQNIVDLCDEFVMTHYFPETNYTKCEVLKEDKDLMIKAVRLKKQHNEDEDLKNEFNIYGCIWTDKGLIYVAKMNEKGVLELI